MRMPPNQYRLVGVAMFLNCLHNSLIFLTGYCTTWYAEVCGVYLLSFGPCLPSQAPHEIVSLFSGSRQVVYGFVPHCKQATLRAKIGSKHVDTMVSTSELGMTKGRVGTGAMYNVCLASFPSTLDLGMGTEVLSHSHSTLDLGMGTEILGLVGT